jgi:uncharacterized membrane protein
VWQQSCDPFATHSRPAAAPRTPYATFYSADLSHLKPYDQAVVERIQAGGQVSGAGAAIGRRPGRRAAATAIAVLIAIVLTFAIIRVFTDWPHIVGGTVPDDPFAVRYVLHPVLSYAHIVAGTIYLLGAPFQLSYRFRSAHYTIHRRLGRVLLTAGLIAGVFALAFGIPYAFGGSGEAAATAVFGAWFLVCLALAYRAIRSGDMVRHRRWMIRAFMSGLAVGTIRIWVGIFTATGVLDFRSSFALAFWLAFTMHAAVAELWVRRTPPPTG